MTLAPTLKKLSVLLRHDDPAHVAQGVALALSLDDPRVIDALLEGTEVTDHPATEHEPAGQHIAPGPRIKPPRMGSYANALAPLLQLITASEHPTARALRGRITEVSLNARTRHLDLSLFPALEQLELLGIAPTFDALHTPRTLRALRIFQPSGFRSLRGVESLRALVALDLHLCEVTSLEPLRGLPALRSLLLDRCPVEDLSPLAQLPGLTHLTLLSLPIRTLAGLEGLSLDVFECSHSYALTSLVGAPAFTPPDGHLLLEHLDALRSFDGLERTLPSLTSITLKGGYALMSLDALRGATQLGVLTLEETYCLESLAGLDACATLTDLVLHGAIVLPDVSALRALPNLRRVVLANASSLTDVTPLATLPRLEALDLRGATALSDVSALVACPRLKTVALHGSGVRKSTVPSPLRAKCTWAKTVAPARLK